MSNQSVALASRLLHAIHALQKNLDINHLSSKYGHLNISQIRILAWVFDNPGICADDVIERLELPPQSAKKLILAMEEMGLLALEHSNKTASPSMRLGKQGQQVSFQAQATQIVMLTNMLGALPESDQLVAVEMLEKLTSQPLE